MATRTIANAGGNWSATTTWVEGAVPLATDDVVATATSGNLTIDVAASCNNFDLTNYVGTLTHAAGITLTHNGTTFKLVAGMTYTLGNSTTSAINFAGTGATSVTTAGKTLGSISFTGAGGTDTLQDALTVNGSVTLTAGTLNTNSKTCIWGSFNTSNSNTRTITLGSSAITLTAGGTAWTNATSTGLTVTANTATATFTGNAVTFNFGVANWNGLSAVVSGAGTMIGPGGGCTLNSLTRTGTATKTDGWQVNSNFTLTGTLTLGGSTTQGVNRLLVQSTALGTQRAITCAAVVINGDVDFMDIALAGSPSWTNASNAWIGDCLGNSGQTFTPAATQTWQGTSGGSWSDVTKWTSRAPLPQDNVVISSAFIASQTITVDMPRTGKDIDASGAAGGVAYNFGVLTSTSFGSVAMSGAMGNVQGGGTFWRLQGRGSHTINSNGLTWGSGGGGAAVRLAVDAVTGTYTFQDTFADTVNGAPSQIQLISGTMTFNANVSIGMLVISGGTFNGGANIVTATANGGFGVNVFSIGGGTVNCANTTFRMSPNAGATSQGFNGGGHTFGTLDTSNSGTGPIVISGSNTFSKVIAAPAKTVTFTSAQTQTITDFIATGSTGNVITLNATTPGTAATLSVTNKVGVEFCSIQDITAAGAGSPFFAANSTNISGNTNWNFAAVAPVPGAFAATSAAAGNLSATTTIPAATSASTSTVAGNITATTKILASSSVSSSTAAGVLRATTKIVGAASNSVSTAAIGRRISFVHPLQLVVHAQPAHIDYVVASRGAVNAVVASD